jgi:hypothetical protein
MKRTRYIIIFVLVLAIIVVAGIFYRNRSSQNPSPAATSTSTSGGLPIAHLPITQNGGGTSGQNATSSGGVVTLATSTQFGLVADIPVLNYFVDTNNTVFDAEPDGQIARISNNTATVISSSTVPNLRAVSFSYDGQWMLREYGAAGQHSTFSLFDIPDKKELLIPGNIESPAWAPDSERLVFFTDSGTTRGLATLNLSDKIPKAKLLLNLAMQDMILSWVRPDAILLTEHPSVQVQGSVYLLTISKKTIQTIVSEQFAAAALWDPAHPYGLLFESTSRGKGGVLYLAGESSANIGLIPLSFLTFPSKCTFATPPFLFNITKATTTKKIILLSTSTATSSTTGQIPSLTSPLYCLIPADRSALDNSSLPDLYEQKGIYTSDNIFRVDPSTGETTMLYNAALQLDGTHVKVAGNRLFFINRFDSRLYVLSLP